MHNDIKRKDVIGDKMISYKRLWDKLNKESISQYHLKAEGISNSTLTRLKKNEYVSTETIDKLCRILQCSVEEIMEYQE